MKTKRSAKALVLTALAAACVYGFGGRCASAQTLGGPPPGRPFNALDHMRSSLEDLQADVRARAGWREAQWVCQPSGGCVWHAGYWGPPPAPLSPPRTGYLTMQSLSGFPWIGYAPQ